MYYASFSRKLDAFVTFIFLGGAESPYIAQAGLPAAEITAMGHHVWLKVYFLKLLF
jgi:hypothetical protein